MGTNKRYDKADDDWQTPYVDAERQRVVDSLLEHLKQAGQAGIYGAEGTWSRDLELWNPGGTSGLPNRLIVSLSMSTSSVPVVRPTLEAAGLDPSFLCVRASRMR